MSLLLFWTRFVIWHIWGSDYCITWPQWNRKEYIDEYSLWTMPTFWWWEFLDVKKKISYFGLLVWLTKVPLNNYLFLIYIYINIYDLLFILDLSKHVQIDFFQWFETNHSVYKCVLLFFYYTYLFFNRK